MEPTNGEVQRSLGRLESSVTAILAGQTEMRSLLEAYRKEDADGRRKVHERIDSYEKRIDRHEKQTNRRFLYAGLILIPMIYATHASGLWLFKMIASMMAP